MSKTITLTAQPRTVFGRKVNSLRKAGFIPANIYGGKIESQAISITVSDFKPVYKEAGETNIVTLTVDGEQQHRPTLIYNLQADPVTRQVLHVDFRQVDLKEKIHSMVAIELAGESPAAALGAVVVTIKNEIEIEALPTEIPESIKVDISKLMTEGDSILVSDLQVDTTKVKILAEPEETIVRAEAPQKEEEPAAAETEVPEGEEAPAEKGEEAPAEEAKE